MHSFKDIVQIKDRVILSLGRRLGTHLLSHQHDPLTLTGHFSLYEEARGNPKLVRDGDNVCTQTGREWLARLMSFAAYLPVSYEREDRIRYIGFGSGSQEEVSGVTSLVTPIRWRAGPGNDEFLAELDPAPLHGLASSTSIGTTSRYLRTFEKTNLSITGSVSLSEAGLFTDLSPAANYAPGSPRSVLLIDAGQQPPMFYKAFEPYLKTQRAGIIGGWELRL